MTLVYFKLAFAGVLGGCGMLAAGLGLYWQGAAAVLLGAGALWLGVRRLRASGAADPRATDARLPVDEPHPSGAVHGLLQQVDADPDGAGFVVGYGDYLSNPTPFDPDPWKRARGQRLELALRATPGADAAAPVPVGRANVSGLLEDEFVRYECRVRVSPANVLALRATRFVWTDAAARLAPAAPPEAVEAIRRTMAEFALRDAEAHGRVRELLSRLGEVDPGSAEAAALRAELQAVGTLPGRDPDA